jgi:hypothetical protein
MTLTREGKESPFSEEEDKRRGYMLYKLIESGYPEVLHGLMGILTMKIDFGCELDEYFADQIFIYYTHEQIMDAVFDKFDAIYDNQERMGDKYGVADILENICSHLWSVNWKGREDGRDFRRFREWFNKQRPRHAERFLNGMSAYPDEDEKAMIETLREDMKKWGREGDSEKEEKAEEMAKERG